MEIKNVRNDFSIILIHALIGAALFYFLVHPLTMVLYGFEFSHQPFSFSLIGDVLKDQLWQSFSFRMMGMNTTLTVFGTILGGGYGMLWRKIREKRLLIDKQERLLQRDINKIIEMGENERVEFKSSIRYDYNKKTPSRDLELVIAKTIVGFMNSRGGKLIIGVDDTGEILGLESDFKTLRHKNTDGYERKIFEIIANNIGQQYSFKNHVSFHQIQGEKVCVVDIENSPEPAYLSKGENTVFFTRIGNATCPLTVKETVEYLEMRK